MQCNHCGKIVPSTSKICMFCNQEIDPNAKYIPPEEESLGSIDNTDYDTKLNFKVVNDYLKNPMNKKYVYAGIGVIVVFVIIFVLLIMSVFRGKDASREVFLKVLDEVNTYLDSNVFYKNGHTGSASVEIKYNKDIDYYLSGDYVFDPINKYYYFGGNFDGKYSSSDIKIDSKELPINVLIRENSFYIESNELSEQVFYSDISLINEFLNLKGYDMDKLEDSVYDSLVSTLKSMSFKNKSEKINFRGKSVNAQKASLVLDSSNMLKFLTKFLTELSESTKFVNQFGAIKNMDKDQTKTYLKDLIKTYEYKYGSTNKDVLTIDIYYSKKTVYRISATEESNGEKKLYQLDINDGAYYFDYFKNDTNIYSGSLNSTVKELTNKYHGEINITFDSDSYLTDIKIKYDDDKKASYKKKNYEEVYDLASLSDEEYEGIKNKFTTFVSETKYLDKFRKLFLSDCSSDLECNCSDLTCRCQLNDIYITCPAKVINK